MDGLVPGQAGMPRVLSSRPTIGRPSMTRRGGTSPINALLFRLAPGRSVGDGRLLDPFGGIEDAAPETDPLRGGSGGPVPGRSAPDRSRDPAEERAARFRPPPGHGVRDPPPRAASPPGRIAGPPLGRTGPLPLRGSRRDDRRSSTARAAEDPPAGVGSAREPGSRADRGTIPVSSAVARHSPADSPCSSETCWPTFRWNRRWRPRGACACRTCGPSPRHCGAFTS